MRVKNWGIGVVIAAAVVLTGCAAPADKPADEKPTSSSEETTAPSSDCPELAEGAAVDITALGTCSAESMKDSAGYAATSNTLGMESTVRYDPADKAIELVSPMGSMVVIGDDAWVKSTGEWQVADPASSDPVIAGLSSAAATANTMDPATAALGLNGDFTVTGTSERLGEKVFVVSGTTEQEGVSVDATLEVTEDYIILATTTSAEVNGQAIDSVFEITDWNVAQDIVAPL